VEDPVPDRDLGLQTLTRDLRILSDGEAMGSVRWFNGDKGYGFIAPDDGGDDVFVRFSALEGDGFRTLEPRQRVAFVVSDDERGPRAERVRLL
jgi:cold shock protein